MKGGQLHLTAFSGMFLCSAVASQVPAANFQGHCAQDQF